MYVIDSNIIIEFFNNTELSKRALRLCNGENALTTSICQHEVLAGARKEREIFIFSNLFNGFEILEHNAKSAFFSSEIYRDLKNKGKMIGDMDILIAGICRANNATLITLDKDFEKIDGLDVKVVK